MAMTIQGTDRVDVLTKRLTNGLDLLVAREHTGETDSTYDTWLKGWLDLLAEYVALETA